MKRILKLGAPLLLIFLSSSFLGSPESALAQGELEEAIILNQELQFLEDSSKTISASLTPAQAAIGENNQNNENNENNGFSKVDSDETKEFADSSSGLKSLEEEYFGAKPTDEIQTKLSAPKRRQN